MTDDDISGNLSVPDWTYSVAQIPVARHVSEVDRHLCGYSDSPRCSVNSVSLGRTRLLVIEGNRLAVLLEKTL